MLSRVQRFAEECSVAVLLMKKIQSGLGGAALVALTGEPVSGHVLADASATGLATLTFARTAPNSLPERHNHSVKSQRSAMQLASD